MGSLKPSIDAIRDLERRIFSSQFLESVSEHKCRNNSQFLNVLIQLRNSEFLLREKSKLYDRVSEPFLRELGDVIGKAIALVKDVYLSSGISPELCHSAEHYLEVFTDLRWWTYVILFHIDEFHHLFRSKLWMRLCTPKGVSEPPSEPASSRLARLVQKLYVWWSGSDSYVRHLPSCRFMQNDLLQWPLRSNISLEDIDLSCMGPYIIEGTGTVTVPALGAHIPPRVKDRKVDLTQDVLGVSHSALVVKCEDSGTNHALKRVNRSEEQKQPILARLAHPHVVCLLNFWRENGFLFLAMELMEGDLAQLISRGLRKSAMPFPIDVAVHLMLQIAKTMLYLHDLGLTHPHLKSSDVLFRQADDYVKLDEDEVTPRYLLKLGDFRFDPKNDFTSGAQQNVYQFGLICLEMLSTKLLYWNFEERFLGMSENPKVCLHAVMRDGSWRLLPKDLIECIENCLDGTTQFSKVVTTLLIVQVKVLALHADFEKLITQQRAIADKENKSQSFIVDSEDKQIWSTIADRKGQKSSIADRKYGKNVLQPTKRNGRLL